MPQNTVDDKSTLVKLITWANVNFDLCRHMTSLGHNELTEQNSSFYLQCFTTGYMNPNPLMHGAYWI